MTFNLPHDSQTSKSKLWRTAVLADQRGCLDPLEVPDLISWHLNGKERDSC